MAEDSTVEFLSKQWLKAGVQSGDLLLLHSNTRRALTRLKKSGFSVSIESILDSFLSVLGENGTLLLPLFNFDFCHGAAFDIRTTPSCMGALTEAGRLRPGCVRTGNPIYSFGVLGKRLDLFRGVDNFSGYGPDSPFGILHREGGKIAVLDLPDQESMTFYHYIEESFSVDYRFHKQFAAPYTDSDGIISQRTYNLFVRKTDEGVITHVEGMEEVLWNKGLYSGDRPRTESGLRVIDAQTLYDETAKVIAEGKARGMLYEIRKPAA
ncbi:MAG TPA: AAC(3) family N-acetyltransferase [Terriglobales bacterium]|nr:AAC(3) family N-acetyltransferase [Terriglobales bacterium]